MQRSISAFGLSIPVAGDVERVVDREPAASPRLARGHAGAGEGPGEPHYRWDAEGRMTALLAPGSSQWLLFDHGERGALRIRADCGHVYLDAMAHTWRLDNGVVERHGVDAAGRPTGLRATGPHGESVLDLDVHYDAEGRIARLGATAIAYDGDRVVGATPTATDATFEYDEHGNRSARHAPGEPSTRYHYDDAGRLVAVAREGRTIVRYGYDDAGRRVRREDAGGTTLRHYDLAGNLLSETAEDGRAIATYVCVGTRCLARIDGPVGAPAAAWYHLDHAATAWAVTDADGAVVGRRGGPFDLRAPGPYMRRHRDPATGFFDFGARDLDPRTATFTTPDTYTFDASDPRLRDDPRRDPWGGEGPQRTALRHWEQTPALRDRYAFCLADPINNVDLDGHSAWWFLLTIPSSLTWALPNTVIGLIIVVANFIMELIGWIGWIFIPSGSGSSLSAYPWGTKGQNGPKPLNPYDLEDRDHFWINFDATARQGVPWAMFNGSFFSFGRAFTLGNIVLENDLADSGDEGDTFQRYVVPNDPDVQFTLQRAVREHEMQHTLQYSYMGPLFHCLPLSLIARLIENAAQGTPSTPEHLGALDRTQWWKHIDTGGLLGGLVFLLTAGKVKFETAEKVLNPAEWWRAILPKDSRFAEIATQAIDLNNWTPPFGVYLLDILFSGGDQKNSLFERKSGAASGHTYGTVVEAEEDEIFVGQFTRVIGAGLPKGPNATMTSATTGVVKPTTPTVVTWTVTPSAPLPVGSPGTKGAPANQLDETGAGTPSGKVNVINLDLTNNLATERVVNGAGLYFHATAPGTYDVEASTPGATVADKKSVKIEVKDIGVTVNTDVFICQGQTIAVAGDSSATYLLNLKTNVSGATFDAATRTYTAGSQPGTDTIEITATYDATAGPFAKYGDNGALAAFPWVVKTIDIKVKEPTIAPQNAAVFVGASVDFTFDLDPQSASVKSPKVQGSRFDLAAKRFTAARGSIPAAVDETISFEYACRTYTAVVTVKPIAVTLSKAVKAGEAATVNVNGGTGPYSFEIVSAGSIGSSITPQGAYTAGAAGTDVVTVTDANGGRGSLTIVVAP